MAVVLARIDDRLIHGQVMTSWVNFTGANKIIDKNISASDEELAMLKALADNGARVYIQMVAENPRMELDKII